MIENLSYEKLKELPSEQKRSALVELKEKYPHYKEMSEKIGGTPAALANLYLRIVEGKKFGRKKKDEKSSVLPRIVSNGASQKVTASKPDYNEIAAGIEHRNLLEIPAKRKTLFTINLETEGTWNEEKNRIEGILSSLLINSTYKISLSIEEV